MCVEKPTSVLTADENDVVDDVLILSTPSDVSFERAPTLNNGRGFKSFTFTTIRPDAKSQ